VLAKEVERERKRERVQEPRVVDPYDPKQLHGGERQGDVVASVVEELPERRRVPGVPSVLAWRETKTRRQRDARGMEGNWYGGLQDVERGVDITRD
jgi:hypothetical protein